MITCIVFAVYLVDKVLIFQDQMNVTKSSSDPLVIYLYKAYIKCMSLVAEILQTV
jgi:hypothetical protein